jgi:hypothetical protein
MADPNVTDTVFVPATLRSTVCELTTACPEYASKTKLPGNGSHVTSNWAMPAGRSRSTLPITNDARGSGGQIPANRLPGYAGSPGATDGG